MCLNKDQTSKPKGGYEIGTKNKYTRNITTKLKLLFSIEGGAIKKQGGGGNEKVTLFLISLSAKGHFFVLWGGQ